MTEMQPTAVLSIEIVDRRKVLRDFNERNHTTARASQYVGVHVVGTRLVFRHRNGVGTSVFCPDGEANHLRGLRVNDSYRD